MNIWLSPVLDLPEQRRKAGWYSVSVCITPTSSIMNNKAFCVHCSTQASIEPKKRLDSTEVCIRLVILEMNPDRSYVDCYCRPELLMIRWIKRVE